MTSFKNRNCSQNSLVKLVRYFFSLFNAQSTFLGYLFSFLNDVISNLPYNGQRVGYDPCLHGVFHGPIFYKCLLLLYIWAIFTKQKKFTAHFWLFYAWDIIEKSAKLTETNLQGTQATWWFRLKELLQQIVA